MNQATAQNDLKMTITYDGKSVETSTRQLQEITNDIKLHNAFDKLGNAIGSYVEKNIDTAPQELIDKVRSFANIKQEKQMATINPKNLCKAWFAVKDFIDKESDPKKAVMFISFEGDTMEVAGTNGRSLAICQIKAETNIEGTFALSLLGNAYDEFNAFIVALYASVKNKDGMQISQLLSFEISGQIATLSIYEPTLFDNEPSLQINLRLLENKEILPYKRVICDAREAEVDNIFFVNLEILQRVQKAISKLTKQSVVKVMQNGSAYVMIPCAKIDDCELYYIAMGMAGGDIKISDFEFQSIQEEVKIEDIEMPDEVEA